MIGRCMFCGGAICRIIAVYAELLHFWTKNAYYMALKKRIYCDCIGFAMRGD